MDDKDKRTNAANRQWLKDHAGQYAGQWVAIRDGVLLGTAAKLFDLMNTIPHTENVLFTTMV